MNLKEMVYDSPHYEDDTPIRIVSGDLFEHLFFDDLPLASALYTGPDFIVAMANEKMVGYVGESNIIGRSADAVFGSGNHAIPLFIKAAYQSATVIEAKALRRSKNTASEDDDYSNHLFRPIINERNEIQAILHEVLDGKENKRSQAKIEHQYQQLLSYFNESPVAIAILDREDLTFRLANPFYANLIGRNLKDIIDKPFLKVTPEIEGQGFDKMLLEVMDLKIPYNDNEVPVTLNRNGVEHTFYISLTCNPRFNEHNEVSGVSIVAIDMTEQVFQRKVLEETSTSLHGAIALANLGTWDIDVKTGIFNYSERLRQWLGFSKEEVITEEKSFEPIIPKCRELVKSAIADAVKSDGTGSYDIEYEVVNKVDQSKRILHSKGQTYFNEIQEAVKICGTISDVTHDRKVQRQLKNRVSEQTEELASSNDRLELANKKMARTLIELELSNSNLLRSNDELSQYAYVSSHDLQEPLRKIQIYSNLLNEEEHLSSKAKINIDRINKSSARMRLLITDLLEFSRVIKSDKMLRPVDLNETIGNIITDFELAISESNAKITIEKLPKINAIALQMNQLFYNLIGNALKFRDHNKMARITITSKKLDVVEHHKYLIMPLPETDYYAIKIRDNGIGFDAKYAEQIFDVFKRLHPKEIYPGSGIGLALCRRIVTNHEGVLVVDSKPEEGATFTIILPDLKL